MLDKEEIRWLKNTCNELNNLLQRIYGHAFLSVERTSSLPEVQDALGSVVDLVEKASHVTHSMLDYVAACEDYINPKQPHPPATPYGAPLKEQGHSESPPSAGEQGPPPRKNISLEARPASQQLEQSGPSPQTKEAPSADPIPGPAQAPDPTITKTEEGPREQNQPDPAENRTTGNPGAGFDFTGIPVSNPNGSRELILVVDDEVEVGRLIQTMLTEAGYRVIVAEDGFKAIKIYKQVGAAIDLVLLDFAMPLMDGEDVFNELRLIDPNVAVILSSGFPQQAKLSMLLSKGLRGFMPKPYTRDKLVDQVNKVLSLGRKIS